MRQRTFLITILLLFGLQLLPVGLSTPAYSQTSKSKRSTKSKTRRNVLRNKLKGVQSKIRRVRSTIATTKNQEGSVKSNIAAMKQRLTATKRELTEVETAIEKLDRQRQELIAKSEITEKRLKRRKGILSIRLRENYQRRRISYLGTLLESKSLHELLTRGYYVRLIVKADAKLIGAIREDVRQLALQRKAIERREAEQKALFAQLEVKKARYVEQTAKMQSQLLTIQANRANAEEELDDLEAEAHAMTSRIITLSAELARSQTQNPGRNNNAYGGRRAWVGGFARPTDGAVTSGFGMRFHPILRYNRMHTGVDFGGGYGAPIRATASGTVIMAGYNRGYGNCVILDHGNGVTSLYGHCSSIHVRYGQGVEQGQLIARIGATGLATGPHLHFEIRRNGVPVRPW